MIIRPQYLLAFSTIIFGAAPASAQSVGSYAHQVFSGLNVTENGSTPGNSTSFGLDAGTTVQFQAGGPKYSLVDVREFALLLSTSSVPGITLDPATLPTAAVIGGKDNTWSASNSAPILSWSSSSNGSNKNGQIKPGGDTGNVFMLSNTLPKNSFTSYGFDIAVTVGSSETDPFGNGTTPGNISTGRVFVDAPPPVPEASTAAGFMGVMMCSGVALFRRKRAK